MNIKNLLNGNGKTKKTAATKRKRREERTTALLTSWHLFHEELEEKTAELRAEIERIEEPYLKHLAEVEKEIKELVGEIGASVTGVGAKAQYRKEYIRTSWDGKALTGYAAAHPEILVFKSEKVVKSNVSIKLI